jgi:hypothetical protein
MLNELQLMLLDNGLWILPVLSVVALWLLPWTDDEINKVADEFNALLKK